MNLGITFMARFEIEAHASFLIFNINDINQYDSSWFGLDREALNIHVVSYFASTIILLYVNSMAH